MARKPDILIFNPDQFRADALAHLGCEGSITPYLDQTCETDGVSFSNAYCQNPVCTPSRCSFMTGWYPHVHGHRSMKNMLKPWTPNVVSELRRAGYHFWWGGKNDLFAVEKPEDYLTYCDTKFRPVSNEARGHRPLEPLPAGDPRRGAFYAGVMPRDPGAVYRDGDTAFVEGAIERLRQDDGSQPLCLFLPLGLPHPAYAIEEAFYERIDPALLPPRLAKPVAGGPIPFLDTLREVYGSAAIDEATWREVRHIYYAMCCKVDHLFGRLVAALKELGRYDDTLIVFLSDHGDFTGDYDLPEKTHATLQDCLLRVPLLIKPHRGCEVQPGVRSALTELIDLPATLFDLLGIEPDYAVQGQSLRQSLAGDDREIHDAVFAEVGSRAGDRAFKNLDVLKMPPDSFYAMQSRAALQAHTSGTFAVSCRTRDYKYIRRGYNDCHEFYDLRADPGEQRNLHGQAAVAAVEAQFEHRLLDFYMQTADVLPFKQDSRQI